MVERRAWRGVDADLFRFTTTDLRELHVALMAAFEDAAVLAPALNLDQVRAALGRSGWDEPVDDEALQRALTSLVGWELLEATQDHGAQYATPEEFERRNLHWSLTRRGESAIAGVLHALDALRRAVGLQPAVLQAVGDGLTDLAELLVVPPGGATDARIHIRLAEVEGHLEGLVRSVRQFNAHLQRLLRDDATDDAMFADIKRRTVTYLEEYVDGVERSQRRLATAIERVEASGLAGLFDRALTGANLAPVSGQDQAPEWLSERARRWDALRAWFVGEGTDGPRLDGLIEVARTAIIELLRVLERRWDSRRRSASVAHDFRRLAGYFAACPGDADAHRLFRASFGLWSSRHAHLVAVDGESRAPTTSWAAAEPVEVAPSLRTTGTTGNRGRVRPVADPSHIRAARQVAEAKALASHAELRAALLTDGAVRLGSFGRLPVATFREFLSLLATALEAPLDGGGARRAVSVDGRVEVVLVDPGDGRTAAIRTEHGTLHAPDFLVSIALVERRPAVLTVEASHG